MGALNERVLRAIAPYGVAARANAACPRIDDTLVEHVCGRLGEGGGVALLTGPSGAGKSVLLGAIARKLIERGETVVRPETMRIPRGAIVAGLAPRVPLDSWLGCLSQAGLADARLFATRAGDLSEGEAARLRLALAFARVSTAPANAWMLCDEFCSVLDRDTAAGVSNALRRWSTRTGARVIAATAHADIERLLGPDCIVRIGFGGHASLEDGPGRARGPRVRIELGDRSDLRAFAPMHYRSARLAAVCRVLRAVVKTSEGDRLAGVLAVSHPTLNGAWRELAWPGRYRAVRDEHATVARRLNREVRRLSRVIVDPRDRGRGIATRLVRAYLDVPMTPATEAVSAMGRLSPFTASAGMTEYPIPIREADDRLGDMLHAMGLEPWELLDGRRVEAVRRSGDGRWLERELWAWARRVRSSIPKPMRGADDAFRFAALAAGRLCAPPTAAAAVRS